MRHSEECNESDSSYIDINTIKDIFQEVIDEFDLYEHYHSDDNSVEDRIYKIYGGKKIRFWATMNSKSDISNIKKYIESNIIPRLTNMGYHTESELLDLKNSYYFGMDIYY